MELTKEMFLINPTAEVSKPPEFTTPLKSSVFTEISNLIREDCYLPDEIRPKEYQCRVKTSDIKKVLLTGATGTLGPYVLRELLKMPQVTQVICLIRPSKGNEESETQDLRKRLTTILEEMQMLQEINLEKVVIVGGDIAKKNLGLEDSTWEALTDEMDAVIQCAVKVNYLQKYNEGDARSINLAGTKSILEFACSGRKLKHVFYSSSVVSATFDKDELRLDEDWHNIEDFDGKSIMTYPVSKFVGEMIMKEAVKIRGIPGKVFRFPLVGGNSEDGRIRSIDSVIFLFYIFAVKNGIMLDDSFASPILPVDKCAEAGVKLFFNEDVPDGVYNIMSGMVTNNQFALVAHKLGFEVPKHEWSSKTLNEITFSADQRKFAKLFSRILAPVVLEENDGTCVHLRAQYMMFPALKHLESTRMSEFFESKKLKRFLPDFCRKLCNTVEYFEKDAVYALSQGWL